MTDLDDLVAGLTRIQSDRIDIEPGHQVPVKRTVAAPPDKEQALHRTHPAPRTVTQWVTGTTMGSRRAVKAPCLISQLAEAIETGSDRTGTRSVPGSRPPLDMTALNLWTEISYNLAHWAHALGITRHHSMIPTDNTQPNPARATVPPVAALLRAVAAAARDRAEDGILDALTRSCRGWTDRIHTLFSPADGQHGIYGAQCPDCGATTVITPRDGENILTPAIVRAPDREKPLVWYICQACTSMRGFPTYDTEEVPA